jgi:putative tryptophan/tyrosine transport system substrate-binding protein
LAQELVDLKPDAIIAVTNLGAAELKKATSTIPIVVILSSDPAVPCIARSDLASTRATLT